MVKQQSYKLLLAIIYLLAVLTSCTKRRGCTDPSATNYDPNAEKDNGSCFYTSNRIRPIDLDVPQLFQQNLLPPVIPADNPQTVEGITLGRKLFFDPILSGDGTQSCASCHAPDAAFSDRRRFSVGINGIEGDRNAMPLFNLAWNWNQSFFWDGRAIGLEEQALFPVTDPIEMHNTWMNAMQSLQNHSEYPRLFEAAFGTSTIDSTLVTKAIAQFERTLISGNAKFDRFLRGEESLTPQEASGFNVFMAEEGGDCFHCHGSAANPLWTDNEFHNNGLDSFITDKGLGAITGNPADDGKFRTPSLRNLVFTAPYMHDGRFATIDEVLEHYSSNVANTVNTDPLMQFAFQNGVQMTEAEKADLKAFLLTLTDSSFITNPDFQAP